MARRYSTRSRRAGSSATAEPAVGGRIFPAASSTRPDLGAGELAARLATLREALAEPGTAVLLTGSEGLVARLGEISRALPELARAFARVVSAAQPTADRAILAAILDGFGFDVEPGTGVEVMAELVAHQVVSRDSAAAPVVVVVDAADRLPPEDLEMLLELARAPALTLVLAGPPSLVAVVERLSRTLGVDWREVGFGGLSGALDAAATDDASAQAGHSGGSARVARRGTPQRARDESPSGRSWAVIGTLAARLWAAATAPAANPSGRTVDSEREQVASAGLFGFPRRHLVVLGTLIAILVLLYGAVRLVERVNQSVTAGQRVEVLEMPPLPAPEGTMAAVPERAVAAAQEDTMAAAPEGTQARLRTPQAGNRESLELPRSPTAPVPLAEAPAPIIARPADTARPANPPAPADAGAPGNARPPESTPKASGARDADWILAQPASAYTLQLTSLSSAQRAAAYIAAQPDPGVFASYRLLRNGQLFHVVIQGSYPTRAAAEQAAVRLPRSVGNVQPWVRPMGQVQDSIRTTSQRAEAVPVP